MLWLCHDLIELPSLQSVTIGWNCFQFASFISFISYCCLLSSFTDLPLLRHLTLHETALLGRCDYTVRCIGAEKDSSCCSLEMADLPSLRHIIGKGGLQFVHCTVVKLKSDDYGWGSSLDICDSVDIDLPASFGSVHTLIAESEGHEST